MNFRLTVRDNYAGGGCTEEDDMIAIVSGSAGPFLVNQPNGGEIWFGNTTETVTWDVANTGAAPVNCANVEILLSLNGGQDFNTVLLASTPNDGNEDISVPNTPSTDCRIMVKGAGNIFYDVSNNDFVILAGLPVSLLSFDARLVNKKDAILNWTTVSEKDNQGFEIQHAQGNSLAFETIGFVDGHGTTNQRNDYTFEMKDLTNGEHYFRLRQIDFDGKESLSPVRTLNIRRDFVLNSFPNPVRSELVVRIFQEKKSLVSLSLLSQLGQRQKLFSSRQVESGDTEWRFDMSSLPPGTYYLEALQEGQSEPERKVIVKN
ncbi:MAG: T9SS type A sorting domain-containing protein [Lewinellaceae bacterium]|nr:T9SS type A sorting domain-containing protein [Lewinellaceae bacterium]